MKAGEWLLKQTQGTDINAASLPRIASLTSSNTEIVAALGCINGLIAVDSNSDWPPAHLSTNLEHATRLGRDLEIDLDLLEAQKPDLVLASLSVPGMEPIVRGCQERGLKTLVLDPTSWTEVLVDVLYVAEALGVNKRGRVLVDTLREWVETWVETLSVETLWVETLRQPLEQTTPLKVAVEWWPRPVIVACKESWITEMLERLGTKNAFAHLEQRSSPVSSAEVVETAPELIVCSWCGVRKLRPELIAERQGWGTVPAVRQGQIVAIPESGLGRPGPRLLEGFEALTAAIKSCRLKRALAKKA